MHHWNKTIGFLRGFLLLALALSYVISSILGESFSILLLVLVILLYFVAWPGMSGLPKILSGILLIFGNALFFIYGGNATYWQESFLNNIGLVSLFISVPLLSYPLKNGGYIEYMDKFINHYIIKDAKVIAFVTATSCITSSFLNMGSVRMVYDLFSERLGSMRKAFAKSMIQGFSLASFWSPYFAGVAIILHLVGVSFISFLFYGLIMAIVSFVISLLINLMSINHESKKEAQSFSAASSEEQQSANMHTPVGYKKGVELIVAFLGLFSLLFVLERWFHYDVLLLISLIAFTYPIMWSFFIKKLGKFIISLKDYVSVVVPNVHNEAIMIISATFFAQMVQLTDFPILLSNLFLNISQFSVILIVLIIILVVVGLGIVSHQILPVSVFATTLSPEIIGLKPELFVLALVIGWGLTPLISPISATNLLVGSLFKTKTFEIGQWNMRYVLTIILISATAISVMNRFV